MIFNKGDVSMKKQNRSNIYHSPEVLLMKIEADIITYSETEEWEGPIIQAGQDDSDN